MRSQVVKQRRLDGGAEGLELYRPYRSQPVTRVPGLDSCGDEFQS